MNKQVLSRHLLFPGLKFHQQNLDTNQPEIFDYNRFTGMIDHWKYILVEKYNAKHGQTILIEFNLTNMYYFTAVFAAWELGLVLIVDWPHAYSEQGCHGKSFTIHGKIDHAIVYSEQLNPNNKIWYREWDVYRNRLYCGNIITEIDFDSYQIEDHGRFKKIAETMYANPNSQAIWTATSGSTGDPKQQRIDHRSAFLQAERITKHLNFKSDQSVLHTHNLHHGASACYHFLPSLMTCANHYTINYDHRNTYHNERLAKFIQNNKINRIFLYTPDKILAYLQVIDKVDHELEITTLFFCSNELVSLAKQKNVKKIYSMFGDTTIAYGFLIKIVDLHESLDNYEPNCMGPRRDEFFNFEIRDGHLYIQCSGLGQTNWQTSKDNFEIRDNKYYFLGRGNDYRINDEWINHNEIESKVNELFSVDQTEGATIIVDNEEQQVYLAIWIENPKAEIEFDSWLARRYKNITVTKRAQNLDQRKFMGARKISRVLLREHFRSNVQRSYSLDRP